MHPYPWKSVSYQRRWDICLFCLTKDSRFGKGGAIHFPTPESARQVLQSKIGAKATGLHIAESHLVPCGTWGILLCATLKKGRFFFNVMFKAPSLLSPFPLLPPLNFMVPVGNRPPIQIKIIPLSKTVCKISFIHISPKILRIVKTIYVPWLFLSDLTMCRTTCGPSTS